MDTKNNEREGSAYYPQTVKSFQQKELIFSPLPGQKTSCLCNMYHVTNLNVWFNFKKGALTFI